MNSTNIDNGISLIVSDIEGCISHAKGVPLDLLVLNKIQSYNLSTKKTGLPQLTLCSGRPQPFVEAFSQMLAVSFPCVCENGAVIYNPLTDQNILHPNITKKHLLGLKDLKRVLSQEISKLIPHKIEPGKEICISLNPVSDLDQYSEKIGTLYKKIIPLIDSDLFEITHSASAVDITPRGIDKGTGLAFLSELMKIPLDQIMGIGDTQGDLPFLNKVKLVGVPANAQKELRDIADFVSTKKSAEGILDIIHHITSQ